MTVCFIVRDTTNQRIDESQIKLFRYTLQIYYIIAIDIELFVNMIFNNVFIANTIPNRKNIL